MRNPIPTPYTSYRGFKLYPLRNGMVSCSPDLVKGWTYGDMEGLTEVECKQAIDDFYADQLRGESDTENLDGI